MCGVTLSDFVSLSVKWNHKYCKSVKLLSAQLLLRVWCHSFCIHLLSTIAVPDTRALRIQQNEQICPSSLEHSAWRKGRQTQPRQTLIPQGHRLRQGTFTYCSRLNFYFEATFFQTCGLISVISCRVDWFEQSADVLDSNLTSLFTVCILMVL